MAVTGIGESPPCCGRRLVEKVTIYWKSSIGFIAQNFVPLDRNWLRYSKKRRPGQARECECLFDPAWT